MPLLLARIISLLLLAMLVIEPSVTTCRAQAPARVVLNLNQSIPVQGGGTFAPIGSFALEQLEVSNDGHWLALIRRNSSDKALVLNGLVILKNGDAVGTTPPSVIADIVHQSFNNIGDWAVLARTTSSAELLIVGGSIWIQGGVTPGPSANLTYSQKLAPEIDDAGQVLIAPTFQVQGGGTTQKLLTVTLVGGVLHQNVVAEIGDPVGGFPPPLPMLISVEPMLSARKRIATGNWVSVGGIFTSTELAMIGDYASRSSLIVEGTSTPAGGTWTSIDALAIGSIIGSATSGYVGIAGTTSTAGSSQLIVRRAPGGAFVKLAQTSDVINGNAVTVTRALDIADDGTTIWRGTHTANSFSNIYVDQHKLIGTGDATFDAVPISGIPDPIGLDKQYSISSNGRFVLCWCASAGGQFRVLLVDRVGHPTYCFGDGSGTACPCGNGSTVGSNAGCLNSTGNAGKLAAIGAATLGADSITLQASGMPPNSTTLYFQGSTAVNGGSGTVFGDGLRCAGGSVIRLKIVANNGVGSSFYPNPAAGDSPVSIGGFIGGAGTYHYQAWYRDAAVFCTSLFYNLTNGVDVAWQ